MRGRGWVLLHLALAVLSAGALACAVAKEPAALVPPPPPPSPWAVADARALAAPPKADWSVPELSGFLTRSLPSEEEKVRAVFRWMTANVRYDLEGLEKGTYGDLSPEAVLKGRSAVCEGYASLFEALVREAGIEAVTILGFAKGVGYEAGSPVPATFNHAWNAVLVGGSWRLVDCTWGAGSLDERGRYVEEFDPFYFFTPPERFIYSHLPQDPRWQLLDPPRSRKAFEALPQVQPAFFLCGLRFEGPVTGPLDAPGPAVTVPVVVPAGVAARVSLLRGAEALGEGFARSNATPGGTRVQVLAPQPGSYTIRVFVAEGVRAPRLDWAVDLQLIVAAGSGGKTFAELEGAQRKGKRSPD